MARFGEHNEAIMPSRKELPEKLHSFCEIQAFDLTTNPKRLPYALENLNTVVNKKLEPVAVMIIIRQTVRFMAFCTTGLL
jgi:hypothetical protein